MATSSKSLNSPDDGDNKYTRVTRARHAAANKGKEKEETISAITDDHREDEYELNRDQDGGYNYDQTEYVDHDLREEVKELSTKFDTLLTTLNMHANKVGSTEEIMDQLPDRPSINPQERSDMLPSDSNSEISSSNTTIKISDLSKELMKCIPRYDGSGGAQRLFDYINQFEDFAMNTDYTPEMELTLATAKLNGDAKAWWRDHRNTFPIDHQQRIRY